MRLHKKILLSLIALVSVSAASFGVASANNDVSFRKLYQTKAAVQPNANLIPVKNDATNFLFHPTSDYDSSIGYPSGGNPLQYNQETLQGQWLKGTPNSNPITFISEAYLPSSFNYNDGYLAPQSIAVSSDGNSVYEMGHFGRGQGNASSKDYGQIIKYNLGDIEAKFHTDQNGSMQLIRQAVQWNKAGRKVPSGLTSAISKKNSAKTAYGNTGKKKYHKKKTCKKHHWTYHSKRWIKNHNRYVKSKKGKKKRASAKKTYTKAINNYNNQNNNWNNQLNQYNSILGDIKVGNEFQTGHGQALAVNPVNNQLWYMNYENTPGNKQFMSQIDENTLTPTVRNYISDQYDARLGHSFAFDKEGHAWTWSYKSDYDINESNDGSNKSVAIYKSENITDSKVDFKEVADLQNGPGTYQQTCGLNPKTGTFYLGSDSSFIAVPTSKTSSLNSDDIKTFQMPTQQTNTPWTANEKVYTSIHQINGRETEGLAFDINGIAHFLTDKGPEVFKSNDLQNF